MDHPFSVMDDELSSIEPHAEHALEYSAAIELIREINLLVQDGPAEYGEYELHYEVSVSAPGVHFHVGVGREGEIVPARIRFDRIVAHLQARSGGSRAELGLRDGTGLWLETDRFWSKRDGLRHGSPAQ